MTVKGLHLEPIPSTSPDFVTYNSHLGYRMVKLYKITYETIVDTHSFDWSQSMYFHGTGHCGCLNSRATERVDLTMIDAARWCGNPRCATQGILNYGHLKTFSNGGHFFSPRAATAEQYAVGKSPQGVHLPVFLVKARNIISRSTDIFSVQYDHEIHPQFLAIIRRI